MQIYPCRSRVGPPRGHGWELFENARSHCEDLSQNGDRPLWLSYIYYKIYQYILLIDSPQTLMGDSAGVQSFFRIPSIWHGRMTRPHSEGWNRQFENDHFSHLSFWCETGRIPLLDGGPSSHLLDGDLLRPSSDAASPIGLIENKLVNLIMKPANADLPRPYPSHRPIQTLDHFDLFPT